MDGSQKVEIIGEQEDNFIFLLKIIDFNLTAQLLQNFIKPFFSEFLDKKLIIQIMFDKLGEYITISRD